MKAITDAICDFLEKYPPSLELYKGLCQAGDLYLIGGVLREYRDKGDIQELRDIDIIIDITSEEVWEKFLLKYSPVRNSFGGYKMLCKDFVIDVWILRETWAYREKVISCTEPEFIKYLPETVFLNLDAIIYDLRRDVWYDQHYCNAMKSGEIDIILEKNPQLLLNIVRAFVLKKRYNMSFSNKLLNVIKREVDINKDFLKDLMRIQEERYRKVVMCQSEINQIIQTL